MGNGSIIFEWETAMVVPRYVGWFEYKYIIRSRSAKPSRGSIQAEVGPRRQVNLLLASQSVGVLHVADTDVTFKCHGPSSGLSSASASTTSAGDNEADYFDYFCTDDGASVGLSDSSDYSYSFSGSDNNLANASNLNRHQSPLLHSLKATETSTRVSGGDDGAGPPHL